MKKHITVDIAGLRRRLQMHLDQPKINTGWQILEDKETGIMLNEVQVYNEINRCIDLGYKVIPMCDNIDKDGSCLGHPDEE